MMLLHNRHSRGLMTQEDAGPKIYFSDFFGLEPEVLEEYGAFNVALVNDLPLFVDPFLLYDSENAVYMSTAT